MTLMTDWRAVNRKKVVHNTFAVYLQVGPTDVYQLPRHYQWKNRTVVIGLIRNEPKRTELLSVYVSTR